MEDFDEVSFGIPPELDPEHEAIRRTLTIATEQGPDYAALSDWEDEWARDALRKIQAHGNKWTLTTKREAVFKQITGKLREVNLL